MHSASKKVQEISSHVMVAENTAGELEAKLQLTRGAYTVIESALKVAEEKVITEQSARRQAEANSDIEREAALAAQLESRGLAELSQRDQTLVQESNCRAEQAELAASKLKNDLQSLDKELHETRSQLQDSEAKNAKLEAQLEVQLSATKGVEDQLTEWEAREDDLQAQVQATEKLKADYAASETQLAKAEARALHVQGEYSNRLAKSEAREAEVHTKLHAAKSLETEYLACEARLSCLVSAANLAVVSGHAGWSDSRCEYEEA